MMHKHKIMIAAGILAVFAAFFAATAVTKPDEPPNSGGVSGLTALLEFRLERLEIILAAMQEAMETLLAEMQKAMNKALLAMLQISDDIGEMSDRILLMAGEIGEMADRIVATMELMSETLIALVEAVDRKDAALAGVSVGVGGSATLILSPSEGQTLTDATVFELAGGQDDFILYASGDAGMANPTNILVRDNMLAAALARIKGYVTGDEVFVATKAVDGGSVGGISNTVMLYVP